MANEFNYCVDFTIIHPSINPKTITETIKCLTPDREVMAGSDARTPSGKLIEPYRKVSLSVWSAYLHSEKRLYSGDIAPSQLILEKLEQLRPHVKLFHRLRKKGQVLLNCGIFALSNCAAEIFDAEMIKLCGDLGIDIEFNCYWDPETVEDNS